MSWRASAVVVYQQVRLLHPLLPPSPRVSYFSCFGFFFSSGCYNFTPSSSVSSVASFGLKSLIAQGAANTWCYSSDQLWRILSFVECCSIHLSPMFLSVTVRLCCSRLVSVLSPLSQGQKLVSKAFWLCLVFTLRLGSFWSRLSQHCNDRL